VFFMCATNKDFGPMRVAEAEYQHEGSKQDIPPKDSALEAMATVGLSDREAADTLPPFNMETVVAERDELDEAAQQKILNLCLEHGGEYYQALFEFVTTDASATALAMRHHMDKTTLYRKVRKYYENFPTQL